MVLLTLWYVFVFLVGICVGSFLNVCVARLPYEKSLIWPGSRCATCLQAIRWYDNLPVLSYVLLGGRCRSCQMAIPLRYFLIEILTGMCFVLLFHLEVVANVLDQPIVRQRWGIAPGKVPPEATWIFWHHALLVSFLLAASICDLMEMEIPLSITLWGTSVGLVLSMCFPWPFPETLSSELRGEGILFPPVRGVYAWPIWYPLPDWLPAGSWRLGLATGLAGAVLGSVMLRAVGFLYGHGRGLEGMGIGDADLMMMAGAFIGWQQVIVAFFTGAVVGLVFAVLLCVIKLRMLRPTEMLPFGPALSVGVVLTVLFWPSLGVAVAPILFEPLIIGTFGIVIPLALWGISFLLRVSST